MRRHARANDKDEDEDYDNAPSSSEPASEVQGGMLVPKIPRAPALTNANDRLFANARDSVKVLGSRVAKPVSTAPVNGGTMMKPGAQLLDQVKLPSFVTKRGGVEKRNNIRLEL